MQYSSNIEQNACCFRKSEHALFSFHTHILVRVQPTTTRVYVQAKQSSEPGVSAHRGKFKIYGTEPLSIDFNTRVDEIITPQIWSCGLRQDFTSLVLTLCGWKKIFFGISEVIWGDSDFSNLAKKKYKGLVTTDIEQRATFWAHSVFFRLRSLL